MFNGGYDDGYKACPCFWGDQPGSLVADFLKRNSVSGLQALDLGCGEGKNAAALARAGARVVAVDCSPFAIANGKQAFPDLPIEWQVGDAIKHLDTGNIFDLVIMYGLAHCLPDAKTVSKLISKAIRITRKEGYHIFVSFNDGSHKLEWAHPNFHPTLLGHSFYVNAYAPHEILTASDSILHEVHPHNGIPHHHSITRIEARIK